MCFNVSDNIYILGFSMTKYKDFYQQSVNLKIATAYSQTCMYTLYMAYERHKEMGIILNKLRSIPIHTGSMETLSIRQRGVRSYRPVSTENLQSNEYAHTLPYFDIVTGKNIILLLYIHAYYVNVYQFYYNPNIYLAHSIIL